MTSEAAETPLDRDAELEALRRTFDDARDGQGRLVIVEGEARIRRTVHRILAQRLAAIHR